MYEKIKDMQISREVLSYLFFGVLTTVVDWLIYVGLRRIHVDYRLCTVLSWAGAVLFAFITNKFWVFHSYQLTPAYVIKELGSFTACRIGTGLLTLAGMVVLVDRMGFHDFVSKLLLSILVIILNYIFSKIFIFKKPAKL